MPSTSTPPSRNWQASSTRNPSTHRLPLDVLRSKALGIMAHPALAWAMIHDTPQPPLPGSTEHDHTNNPTGQDTTHHAEGGAPDTGGPVDPDTGRVITDPTRCRGHACGTITVPIAKLQPRLQLYIHLNADSTADIENTATITPTTLREVLDGKHITATPVINLNHTPTEHQHRPSRRLRDAVHLVFPTEAFPFSTRSSRGLDLDHTTAYQNSCRDPQTRLENFGPLSRRAHRAKTAGYWTSQQPIPGKLIWTSPLGLRYLVDNNGTRRLHSTTTSQ